MLDASVVLDALLPANGDAAGRAAAVSLWTLVALGDVEVLQPPHWLAEVTGVLARLSPETAVDDTRDLHALALPVADGVETYSLAAELAVDLSHHLFDTLYHAVALGSGNALLVTSDRRYYRKAKRLGGIMMPADFRLDLLEEAE